MATAQSGIFAIGTSAHCYLEFDRIDGVAEADFVRAVCALDEPATTVGGVNIVLGLRPELLAAVANEYAIPGVRAFTEPITGVDGFTMPATQHDAFVWVAGAAQDLVFDIAAELISGLAPVAALGSEVTGWAYQHNRDLTGFQDGTENPTLTEAVELVVLPDDAPGAGGSVLLVQKWAHDTASWLKLDEHEQELVIGRTKLASIELEDDVKPATSHVSRTVVEEGGEELDIFRRNSPYGTVSEHGTMFIGFSVDQHRLDRMLRRMAGAEDGIRDALTLYTSALSGAYYVVPSVEGLRAMSTV
ncbi:putative iron-dependent peroxidase [Jatrophihabitans sp. GAS493]|uniref:Dyp-type peroxidase n=1 Tax=Jatrophihabitans sp. GAS493 TaxID=1907575 RepID=UPI000BB6BEBF|nr:Dyp-type peroxidase [Jatrophihabitans sp. GAS493]SOD74463.1 putative iron-dependent peroxidase [Jatrophihabitans sp. GAS493]